MSIDPIMKAIQLKHIEHFEKQENSLGHVENEKSCEIAVRQTMNRSFLKY